jgi:hypothetical protein
MSKCISINNDTDEGENVEGFIINNIANTNPECDNICAVCYDENVDIKAFCKGCNQNICSSCFASCINLNLKLDDTADKGISIIYKCVFCRYYNPLKEEQPCDVYRYLIKQLYTDRQEYIKLLEYIQGERRDERRQAEGLRKELEVSKVNIDKLDKYCSETRKKTINKEVIISIIKGVKV